MRFATILLLGWVFLALDAMAQPRVDLHGDPLPEGAIARLGTSRFQVPGPGTVEASALSPDGSIVAILFGTSLDNKVISHLVVLETSTGKCLRKINRNDLHDSRLQFTPDGKHLVATTREGVHLLDPATGKLDLLVARKFTHRHLVAVTPDGDQVVVQPSAEGLHAPVEVWDVKTGKQATPLPGRGVICKGIAFGHDGKHLLLVSQVPTQGEDKTLRFAADSQLAVACIDIASRKIVGETTTGSGHFFALAQDGETVALETADQKGVRVLHLPTGAERIVIPSKQSRFAFSPDGKMLFSVDDDGKATLWDVAKGEKIRDLEGLVANRDFDIAGISNDGRTIAILAGGWRAAARMIVWNATTGRRVARPVGHEGAVSCITYGPDGKVLATGGYDGTVRLWNPATGEHLRALPEHRDAIAAVAISPDGKVVASSCRAGLTRLCNVADGKTLDEFNGPGTGATALAFSAGYAKLIVGSDGALVRTWDIARKKEVSRFTEANLNLVISFGASGTLALLAFGERENFGVGPLGARSFFLQMRDLRTGQAVDFSLPWEREPGRDQIGSPHCDTAMISPEGRLVATSQISQYFGIRPSYGEAKLCLWDRASGQVLCTLAPTVTSVLAFSPTGRLLASGSTGKSDHLHVGYGDSLVIWDTLTGAQLGELPAAADQVAFSPNGKFLATAGRDHDVLIWNVPQPKATQNPKVPTAAERAAWWADLDGNARDAHKTIAEMAASPDAAVAIIKERIRPIPASDPEAVARLIVQLDSDKFDEREKAQQILEKLGEGATSILTKALQGKVSPEVRRRLEAVLTEYEALAQSVQQKRAFAALEWLGTSAARAVLQSLADGAPGARRTIEARAALKRMSE